jgi:3-oxoadipate enol-lactonase
VSFAHAADGTALYYEVDGRGDDLLVLIAGQSNCHHWWDVPRPDFDGTSTGGRVAQWLAADHPDRVDRLVPVPLGEGAADLGAALDAAAHRANTRGARRRGRVQPGRQRGTPTSRSAGHRRPLWSGTF